VPTGRFAPSPTGHLHVGNLRTALLAWLFARSSGSRFLVRVEDLDRVASRPEIVRSHLADLQTLGIDWDGDVVLQSDRFPLYEEALDRLAQAGDLYPCYCTRREVAAAAWAPHGPLPEGAYPGTCRDLSAADRAVREAVGRRPSLRVRTRRDGMAGPGVEVVDRLQGRTTAIVDDFVVRRNDGVPAYQLAVVVDDAGQGVGEVVRGHDLLDTTPRQVWLARRLGLPVPAFAHVPLVLGADGLRLAKRHGAVTLSILAAQGLGVPAILGAMATSLGLAEPGELVPSARALLDRFDPGALPVDPWLFDPALLTGPVGSCDPVPSAPTFPPASRAGVLRADFTAESGR
jgi:glutamyl-tRNA synthetase